MEAMEDSYPHMVEDFELVKVDTMKGILVHCYSKIIRLFPRPKTCCISDLISELNGSDTQAIIEKFKNNISWVCLLKALITYQIVFKLKCNHLQAVDWYLFFCFLTYLKDAHRFRLQTLNMAHNAYNGSVLNFELPSSLMEAPSD